jgi:hypothetical protein
MYLIPVFVWLLFAVGSCAGGGVKAISGVADSVDKLERVSAADGGTVELDAGHKYVYYDSGSSSTEIGPAGQIIITDPSGNQVELNDIDGEQTYSADGSSGLGILQFDAPSDGTYTVTVEGAPASSTGELLIGENVLAAAKSGLVVLVVVGTFGFVVAVIIAIVIARKRGQSKREMQQGYGGGGGWPGGGQPQFQPPSGYGAPASYPPQGGYGAPASYPPAGGGYQPPPPSYPPPPPADHQPPPSSFPPQGGGFPPAGGGYQPPPGGFPPPGS